MKPINLILLGLCLSLLFQACTSDNTCTEKKEMLLYISKKSGNFDIYKNDIAGNERQLTNNPGFDWMPSWDTNKNRILHYAYLGDTFKIQSMDLNGNSLAFNAGKLEEFNLSPDGQYLVQQVRVDDFSKLIITDTLGNNAFSICEATSYNGRAKWSPNSQSILYISDRDGNNELYLYNLESQETKRLTNNTSNEKYTSWAPQGDRIAFTTQYYEEGKPDRNDVFILDLTSGEITQITNNEFNDSEIAWSPQGDRIAFHSTREAGDQIYTMDTNGNNVVQITQDTFYHGEPAWAWMELPCEQ